MKIEMGESLFYSWVRHVKGCQIVQTNWKASPKWERQNEEEVEKISDSIIKCFADRGYSIYNENTSVSQVIKQGESDVLGVSLHEGDSEECNTYDIYAVDVAYHRNGLHYTGGTKENIEKVIFKLFRTAMCIFSYFNTANAEIIFAAPKISDGLYEELKENIGVLQSELNSKGYSFKFRLIANDDFNKNVLEAILECSDDIADTNELFMRSYQLFEMFEKKTKTSAEKTREKVLKEGLSKSTLEEIPVGRIVRNELKNKLEMGYVTDEEIQKLLTLEYCKETFKLSFPLLTDASKPYDEKRYYKSTLVIDKKEYKLCNHWFDKQKQYLISWLEEHNKSVK